MDFLVALLGQALGKAWVTFAQNWYYLVLGAAIAALLKVYVDAQRVADFFRRHTGASVLAAVAVAVGTPLCSCGTMAVVLGMLSSAMPWAPVVAFMVSSPLTSPAQLFYSASLLGWPFALVYFGTSILLGLMGGAAAHVAERRGWLRGQARFRPVMGGSGMAETSMELPVTQPARPRPTWRKVARETWLTGWQLLGFFFVFAAVGYLLNGLIPADWIGTLFGSGRVHGVPLAATLGIPFYINTEAAMPLVAAFREAGMSPGATLAFLVTGAGTSIGAIAGTLTIARWRVVALVFGTLWVGAVLVGYAYNAVLAWF